MARVKITWSVNCDWLSNANNSTLEYLDDNGFYAIYLGKHDRETRKVKDSRLLYIGQAYDQTIRQRIQQPHDVDECMSNFKKKNPGYDLFFKSGIVSEIDQQKISSQLVDDVECCMIFRNQPECNTQCRESYMGREIIVEHENPWIIRNSSCEED